jgi:hypothetical protein
MEWRLIHADVHKCVVDIYLGAIIGAIEKSLLGETYRNIGRARRGRVSEMAMIYRKLWVVDGLHNTQKVDWKAR